MLLLPTGMVAAGSGFAMKSLRFNSADSARLNRSFSSLPSTRTKCTISFWIKRAELGAAQQVFRGFDNTSTYTSLIRFTAGDVLEVQFGGAAANASTTTGVWRDVSSHYHFCITIDTTQNQTGHSQTDSRVRVYVNGVQVATTGTLPAKDAVHQFTHTYNDNYIGCSSAAGGQFLRGYLSDFVFVDGSAYEPSNFAQTDATTGQWVPKPNPTQGLTMGTNGFWLSFDDNSNTTSGTLGADDAGGARGGKTGSNDWTPTNFSVAAGAGNDSLFDVPMSYDDGVNGRGNFCTLNPLTNTNSTTLNNGNLDCAATSASGNVIRGTIFVPTTEGIYFEFTPSFSSAGYAAVGVVQDTQAIVTPNSLATVPAGMWVWRNDALKGNNGASSAYGTAATTGEVHRCAIKDGKIWWGDSVGWFASGDPAAGTNEAYSGLTGDLSPMVNFQGTTGSSSMVFNFGQRAFAYTPPTGFKALCTQNLPEPAILKSREQFDVVAYNLGGVGGDITSLAFQPDLVWIKSRGNATGHRLVDAVRGVTKSLATDTTGDEATEATGLTAFLSNGFTLGTDADYNPNAAQVAWCWKKSATPGFDVVTYTGNGANRTINHNLSAVPKLIIVKARTTAGADTGWAVYHSALANTEYLMLNTTAAKATGATYWNSSTPTSSVFSLGTAADVNTNNDTYVAYLFAEVPGFSRFGSYTGNANVDGAFVWCGFRPRYVLIKRVATGGNNWRIYDTARDLYNAATGHLYTNDPAAEDQIGGGADKIDFLSNGFKLRTSALPENGAELYIFAAFAESPFKYARAR